MEKVLDIGSRREVFWDDYLIDPRHTTAGKRLHHPVRREKVMECDSLWEGDACYMFNMFRDGDIYRMYYYAGCFGQLRATPPPDSGHEYLRICYAESTDGLHWTKPSLGICEYNGSTDNNIIINAASDSWHNPKSVGCPLFVMKDPNENCPDDERYKGVYGVWLDGNHALKYMAGTDGIHFRYVRTIYQSPGYFDSLNTLIYDAACQKYVCYFRGWHRSHQLEGNEHIGETRDATRDICRMESSDFVNWSEPERIQFGEDSPDFHMYTNVIQTYYRAPHLLVGFPSRYFDRREWTDNYEELCGKEARRERMKIQPRFGYSVTDTLFMSSRDGVNFDRPSEAFMRPEPENDWSWVYAEGNVCAGLFEVPSDIPSSFPEMSMLSPLRRWTGDPGGVWLYRYALRPDGFISRHAGYEPETLVTRPVVFAGDTLTINFETSAGGYLLIELLDKTGRPLEGYRSCELFGNTIDRKVHFPNDLKALNGIPVKLRITLCDADIYSFRFIDG